MNEKILIVDDNRDNIRLFQEILSEQKYRVFVALNGKAALASLEEEIPDLILMDIMMPGMNGFELCREIKRFPRLADIPVLFLSARSEIADEMEGFHAGAVDYITKPVSVPILLARVRTHLNLLEARRLLADQNSALEKRVGERTAHLEKALTEKRLLLGEVHHRVLNNLQFISGLIILQIDSLENPLLEPVLTEYENRIHSMAMVHQELYRTDDFTEVDLSGYALSLFRYQAARLDLPDDEAILDPAPERAVLNINFAIPCGLILGEFFSLCFRNAPAGQLPRSGFSLELDREAGRWRLNLYGLDPFSDREESSQDRFSMQVISILVSQLRGEMIPGDTSWEICFPDTPPITYNDVSAYEQG